MPNIKEYNAGDLQIRPTEVGIDATAQSARRISQMGNEAASAIRQGGEAIGSGIKAAGDAYVDWQSHQEISAGAPAAAAMLTGLTQQWNTTAKNTDPNNTGVAGDFRENTIEPALAKFQDAFITEKGQNWAQEQTDAIRNHLYHKQIADQSSMAAAAVTQNATQLINSLSNNARQDPSALDATLDIYTHSMGHIVDSSPSITPEDAARVHEGVTQKGMQTIVQSAFQGMLDKNPDAALKMASDPKYAPYINAGEADRMATEVKRQNKIDDTNARMAANEQRKTTSDNTYDNFLKAMHDPDPTKRPTYEMLRNIPNGTVLPGHLSEMYKSLDNAANKPPVTPQESQTNAIPLMQRVWSGDTGAIDDARKAFSDHKIGYSQLQEIQNQEKLDPDVKGKIDRFMKYYGNVVNPYDSALPSGHNPENIKKEYALSEYVRQSFEETMAKSGKTEALKLLDPTNPNFIGNSEYAKPTSAAELHAAAKTEQKTKGLFGMLFGGSDDTKPAAEAAPPRPKAAPAAAQWDPAHKMYTYVKNGRLVGVPNE